MNKSTLITKSSLFVALILILISFIPTIQAEVPLAKIPRWQNIGWPIWWDDDSEAGIDATEESCFRVGLVQSVEEKEKDWFPGPPYNIRLYINGIEIGLRRFTHRVGDLFFEFYAIFEPGYFNQEEDYTIKFEIWVLKPYQGDGLNEWRIFYDYWGIYGEPRYFIQVYDLVFEE